MRAELKEYFDRKKGQTWKDGTIKVYRRGLEDFSDWLDAEGLAIEEVTYEDLERYLSFLSHDKGFAPKTIRSRYSPINQFFADFTHHGGERDNPAAPVEISGYAKKETKRKQVTKENHTWLSKDEVSQLVENVPAPGTRNRALVLFQYFTGLRRQEVVDVKLADIDRERRIVKVQGKNDYIHKTKWQPKLDRLLTAWLDMGRRDSSPYANESPYLFLTQSTPQLSPSRVSDIVREAASTAGLQEQLYTDAGGTPRYKITSHTLRHSFAMHVMENGADHSEVAALLAHQTEDTAKVYAEMSEQRTLEAYDKYAPDIDFTF